MYDKIKEALIKQREDISYFDEEFFDTYMRERHIANEHYAENVRTEEFIETRKSDFYEKNSGAYCEFQWLVTTMIDKVYEIDFYENGCFCTTQRIWVETEEQAEKTASRLAKEYGYNGIKVRRIR